MANYATLKAAIQRVIKENHAQQITGPVLQEALIVMINALGARYQFAGIAVPTTNPGTPDYNVFYIAFEPGTYANFNGAVVEYGNIGIFAYNGSWLTGVADLSVAGDDYLMRIKANKDYGVNIIDPDAVVTGYYLNPSGILVQASSGTWYVSDYIPVLGHNIISNAFVGASSIASFSVYDKQKRLLRATVQNAQYTYQDGDYYIRVCAQSVPYGNYGTVLASYKPFSDTARLDAVELLAAQVPMKLDRMPSTNLIDPAELLPKSFIRTNGTIGEGVADEGYYVSGYVPVFDMYGEPHDIISNAICVSYAGTYVVYDEDKNIRRFQIGASGTPQYTYQEGDAYVRFGFRIITGSAERQCLANYGTVLQPYSMFTQYQPIADLSARIDALESGTGGSTEFELAYLPNCLYTVYHSDRSKNIVSRLYLSHMLNDPEYKNADLLFENYVRNLPIQPAEVTAKTESQKTVLLTPKTKYAQKSFATKLRTVPVALSKSAKPLVLVIGDSVTFGYGASVNKSNNNLPNQYWAWAKMLFERDKIDGGDNAGEYNLQLLGSVDGDFTIQYSGVQRTVRARAEAKGGASLDELFKSTWGGSSGAVANPFYDSANSTFSILAYLSKYRTMDNAGVRLVSASSNPAGQVVVGSDGASYTIGTAITTQALLASIDVCAPTAVVVNMVHNTTLGNYQTYAPQVVAKIKSELPGVPIVLMSIDETGTYFPCDYPNYDPALLDYGTLHTKNGQIYNFIKSSVEDEANGVYLLGAQFVQPTAAGYATTEIEYIENVGRDGDAKYHIADTSISGRNYHPNNIAHSAFGYALYGMIKWLIS